MGAGAPTSGWEGAERALGSVVRCRGRIGSIVMQEVLGETALVWQPVGICT